ncbi:phosphatase PAP2 family protein [Actinophytocola oryzae]|uniref:PAP2 superfamily protein n=1 Tax=Actinophytocola oryzae TaxID=502181 RepID=A0A4R7W4Z0_9PSEU|nr:phosphatase PAP2 family protein [Actinophytocola oryzae]TDV57793.1 PAP2 superfamily protein [Actinophytocola oryzae]
MLRRPTTRAVLCGLCGLVVLVLGLLFVGDHTASGIDEVTSSAVAAWPHGVLRALVSPTEPYVLLPALTLLAAWCLHRSRPWDASLVVLGPSVALAVNTWVLKPLFDRWKGDTLVYPSGHTVSLVATLTVVFLLAGARARAITAAAGAVLLAGVTIGMLGLGYHYVTDVVGGTFFAVFAVLVVCGLLTAAAGRSSRPGRGGRSSRGTR